MASNSQRIKRHKKRDRARARAATSAAVARSNGLKILSVLDQHLDDLFTIGGLVRRKPHVPKTESN